jgi:nicotinamidase-related amidase
MANPKLEVLTPQNSQIIFIDHQPQMAFGVQSIDRQMLKNNVVALAKAAKVSFWGVLGCSCFAF